MKLETLIFGKEDSIRIITLNRPERLNAISMQLIRDLENVLVEIDEDGEARVVILTGAGRGFCAGADVKEPDANKLPTGRNTFFSKLEDVKKPVIAAINGHCNGGGLELALCCDFRIAAEGAYFGAGEVKLGVMPGGGGTARLPRLIGPGRAKEFLYFGNRIDAHEAYRIGLVNKVVSLEKLMEEARNWAAELAERPPLSVKMLKDCVNLGMQMDLAGALDYEAKCSAVLAKSEDRIEGIQAFVEKRKPVFKGR
jgi:enoyl-CoA hydratase/carnithine racemase